MNRLFTYGILFSLTLVNSVLWSQTQIEILNADEISFNKNINPDRQVLSGAVKAKHNDRFLTCDSAYYYTKENKIEAFNNIHIWEEDSLNLRGDYLVYLGNEQIAEIENDVQLEHKQMQLITEQLEYNFELQQAKYDFGASITDEEKSLSSEKGIYFAEDEKFDFQNNVEIEHSEGTLKSEQLTYWLNTEFAKFSSKGQIENSDFRIDANKGWLDQKNGKAFLYGEVKITDIKNAYTLHADTSKLSDELQESVSFGNTLLKLPLNEDSLYLTADTLIQTKISEHHLIKAFPAVSFKNSDMLGACDSMSFNTEEERIFMDYKPVIWFDEFQLTAKKLEIQLRDNDVRFALFKENAFIASEVDSKAFNQISGVFMKAHFTNNDLSSIDVNGNGESIYFMQNEKSKTTEGVNKIICSDMKIFVKEKDIQSINFYKKPDAVLQPIDQAKSQDLVLKGFKWVNRTNTENEIQTKIEEHHSF